jgi:hypothetical protein
VVAVVDELALPTRRAALLVRVAAARRVTLEQTLRGAPVAQYPLAATHWAATAVLAVRGVQMALWAKTLSHQTRHSFMAALAAQPVVL